MSQNAGKNSDFELHFNQNEEFFLRLPRSIRVPALPVHHDVRNPEPDQAYLRGLRSVLSQLVSLLPEAFMGLDYFFDPSDTLRPCFSKLFKAGTEFYLYILRIDLSFRPQTSKALRPGSNDVTAEFETKDLYADSEFIPLEGIVREGRTIKAFQVRELISTTWIGETGKGYMVRGIWMDADLSRFFTKLFLPEGKSVYPYFPLFCKYKTVCHQSLRFDSGGRKEALALFHRQAVFLRPWIGTIQKALKGRVFSETMQEFADLRRRVPESWLTAWPEARITPYLNDEDMKEYLLEFRTTLSR